MISILTVALFAFAQPVVAPRPPQAPPVAVSPPKATRTYADYRSEAIAKGLPIVIFVRCPERPIAGAVTVRVDHLDGYDSGPNIVIGVPDAAVGMKWKATLERDASDAAIRRELVVTQTRLPFFKSLRERRTADDSVPNARQLPAWFPKEAKRYHHAEYTQAIYILNDQRVIEPIHRTRLERKWQFPGGLDSVDGWASDLYAFVPNEAKAYQAFMPVKNSFGHYQNEIGWKRDYPSGSWFADVLSKDGDVFEIRVREKQDGQWASYVAFRDARKYPDGYISVSSRKCAECHNQAGTGEYGVGLVSGSDTVLSDPFAGLESR